MASCCFLFFTILPSLVFLIVGLLVILSEFCTGLEGWILSLYLFVTFVYVVNIEASFIQLLTPIEIWVPSLWGKIRWINGLCWIAYTGTFFYFLWFHQWPGFSNGSECMERKDRIGFISVSGMVWTAIVHLFAVILWKMCRRKRGDVTSLFTNEPLLPTTNDEQTLSNSVSSSINYNHNTKSEINMFYILFRKKLFVWHLYRDEHMGLQLDE